MSEELLDLAKRAVAADGYTLMLGMRLQSGAQSFIVTGINDDGEICLASGDWVSDYCPVRAYEIPDFSDQLTCQSVMLMVRAKHGAECYPIINNHQDSTPERRWLIVSDGGKRFLGYGPTGLAAWVAALEAER